MHLNVLSAKWRPFLFGLNVFKGVPYRYRVYYFPYPQSILHTTGYYYLNWLTQCDLRAGRVLYSRSGRVGGCQTCGNHISVTTWQIFSVWSLVELSRPLAVHCHGHLSICSIWACPWAKNLSNLPQIGSRPCGMQLISETAGWNFPI